MPIIFPRPPGREFRRCFPAWWRCGDARRMSSETQTHREGYAGGREENGDGGEAQDGGAQAGGSRRRADEPDVRLRTRVREAGAEGGGVVLAPRLTPGHGGGKST